MEANARQDIMAPPTDGPGALAGAKTLHYQVDSVNDSAGKFMDLLHHRDKKGFDVGSIKVRTQEQAIAEK